MSRELEQRLERLLRAPAADQQVERRAFDLALDALPQETKGARRRLRVLVLSGATAVLLLSAVLATAEELGVRPELEGEWSRDGSNLAQQARDRARGVTAKAWRFAGEMEEIAATFKAAGLPDGFHAAAAEVYRRMAHFKGAPEKPSVEEVLKVLSHPGKGGAA